MSVMGGEGGAKVASVAGVSSVASPGLTRRMVSSEMVVRPARPVPEFDVDGVIPRRCVRKNPGNQRFPGLPGRIVKFGRIAESYLDGFAHPIAITQGMASSSVRRTATGVNPLLLHRR